MKIAAGIVLGMLLHAASLFAQEALVGKYSGIVVMPARNDRMDRITLDITRADNGKLQGTANRYAGGRGRSACVGEYKIEGKYEGNVLEIRSTEGGGVDECRMNFRLVAEGGKLKGKFGSLDIELSK